MYEYMLWSLSNNRGGGGGGGGGGGNGGGWGALKALMDKVQKLLHTAVAQGSVDDENNRKLKQAWVMSPNPSLALALSQA